MALISSQSFLVWCWLLLLSVFWRWSEGGRRDGHGDQCSGQTRAIGRQRNHNLYSSLSEDELVQMAIEQSLADKTRAQPPPWTTVPTRVNREPAHFYPWTRWAGASNRVQIPNTVTQDQSRLVSKLYFHTVMTYRLLSKLPGLWRCQALPWSAIALGLILSS